MWHCSCFPVSFKPWSIRSTARNYVGIINSRRRAYSRPFSVTFSLNPVRLFQDSGRTTEVIIGRASEADRPDLQQESHMSGLLILISMVTGTVSFISLIRPLLGLFGCQPGSERLSCGERRPGRQRVLDQTKWYCQVK